FDFPTKADHLNGPNGIKMEILNLRVDASASAYRNVLQIWARRFALLQHLGIRSDVLILRKGEQIPPHGHYRVVSGFYLLEGEVGIRHYDRVRELGQSCLVRKVLDNVLTPGGFTTNSEFYHNIHWVYRLADVSYLFRITVRGTQTKTFGGQESASERVYLDPTGAPDENGLIAAPYITDQAAKNIPFDTCEPALTVPH